MATIVELGGVRPAIGEDVWLAPTAVLIGDVHVGDRASIGSSSRMEAGRPFGGGPFGLPPRWTLAMFFGRFFWPGRR